MTNRVAALASISIDCPNPDELAPFYCALLGLDEVFATPDRGVVSLGGAAPGLVLTLMRVADHVAPTWPGGEQRQQMHLDLAAEDLDRDVAAAVAIGAREASVQPAPQQWRVLLDPAGHPLCLSAVRPD